MRSTKLTQIENIQFKSTKHCDAKYSHSHQVLNITYSNPLYDIEYQLLDNTRTRRAPEASSTIKGKKTAMVNSLATDTDDILKITNILNKCTLYTKVKEGDSQTLKNEENFKAILKDSGKENKIELTSTSK